MVQGAFDKARKHRKKRNEAGEPPAGDPPKAGPPGRLPFDSPVKALGRDVRNFYFLNCVGQFIAMQDKDLGRLAIIALFGGVDYLKRTWPKFDKSGTFVVNFDHSAIGEVLIDSCTEAGIWSPEDNVRGVGTWYEEKGPLVMHCGDVLFLSDGGKAQTGLRGKLLYPSAPAQPHPIPARGGKGGPADILLDKLRTWNWSRGEIDAKLHLGWMGAAILGAAANWRPMEWVTGGSGVGKSTLMKLTRWTMGHRAMIATEDATPAGIKHKTQNSSLPVSVDELESEADSQRARDIIKLARICSSGGESLRGSPGGVAQTFIARNVFQFSSIVIPPLPQQDKNRMAILNLEKVEWAGAVRAAEPGADVDEDEDEDDDAVLGKRSHWVRIGQALRGRILGEWPRYRRTFRAYRVALGEVGHNQRGQDQFGSIGAGYDLLMFDGEPGVEARAADWAKGLPAATTPETSGYKAVHEQCLDYLLRQPVDAWRGGVKESVGSLLRKGRGERIAGTSNSNDYSAMLEQLGIKIFRDKRDETQKAWWVAISNSNAGLALMFRGTPWHGIAGGPGAWAQMVARLDGAVTKSQSGGPLRLRFDGRADYCTAIPWETVFKAISDDEDEVELVNDKDRVNE